MSAPFDWQAYLDGSMSSAELEAAERRLAEDPAARRELEGLKAFRAELKARALAEEAPLSRLEAGLAKLAPPPRRSRAKTWGAIAAVAAAACLAMFFLVRDPLRLDTIPTRAKIPMTSVVEARDWVREKSGIDAPTPDATSVARITMARYGDGWACFDYEKDGELCYIYVRRDPNAFAGARTEVRDGQTFYVGKGIGWHCGEWAYYVRGGSDHTRWEIATAAAKATCPPSSGI